MKRAAQAKLAKGRKGARGLRLVTAGHSRMCKKAHFAAKNKKRFGLQKPCTKLAQDDNFLNAHSPQPPVSHGICVDNPFLP